MNTKIAARSTVQKPAVEPNPVAETIKRISTDSSAIIAATTVLLFILACIFVHEFGPCSFQWRWSALQPSA